MHRIRTILFVGLIGLVASVGFAPATQAEERQCFDVPLISNCIEGRFLSFWRDNGGLAVFGYPITPAFQQVNEDTGQPYLTQYFERQRFELHLENAAPYDVLLGRLGVIKEDITQPGWREMDAQARAYGSPEDPYYFPETNQNVGPDMIAWFTTHGLEFDGQPGKSIPESVALFGLPMRLEVGNFTDPDTRQVFERAVLEYHPELPGAPTLGDRLGVWYVRNSCFYGPGLFSAETCAAVDQIAYP